LRSSLLALLLASLLPGVVRAGEAAPGALDWGALLRGDVQIEAVESSDALPGLRASFAVRASAERIWAALLDYPSFPAIFAGVERLQVLEQDEHGARVEFWVDAVLTRYHYVLDRRYEQPGRRLTWRRSSGDLERIEGSWEIRESPQPGVQLLVYESYVKAGRLVPTSWIRWGATRKAREMALRLREWLERPPSGS
jgi:ribosome-associated toxin RatA of RatAB toxin-antitoxin module